MPTTTSEYPTIVTAPRLVPNAQPIVAPSQSRVAIIGEAPGEDEENYRIPFVGRSGQFLTHLLKDVGIDRYQCLVGNVCQVRPPGNKIELFRWDGPEIQGGLTALREDIQLFNPNICLLLGASALRAAGHRGKISDWHGSLFISTDISSPLYGRKCIPSIHPAFVLREFSGFPLLRFDLKRAAEESLTSQLILPQRERITNATADFLCHIMDTWKAGVRCSVDIEGGLPDHAVNEGVKKDSKLRRHLGWRCVSLSARPTRGYCIAWWKFTEDECCQLMRSFARLMERRDVPKVLQNSLYDSFVLAYGYGIHIANVTEDVMLKGWEVYCELRKGLAAQAAVWTREPHWKDDTMYVSEGDGLAQGCCTDTTVTLEICEAQDNVLEGLSLQHYRKNIEMLNPALYMELRGIRYDVTAADQRLASVFSEMTPIGDWLGEQAGIDLRGPKGFLVPQRLMNTLYRTFSMPVQKKKGPEQNETSDQEAMLHLWRQVRNDPIKFKFVSQVLAHKRLESKVKQLRTKADADGRVRSAYNLVGTETGRFSCRKSPTGSGNNLQTQMPENRDLLLADPGMEMFQADLSGADGWTVAAHCLRLGDPTMYEDYLYGLKPAHIIGLLYTFGQEVNELSRDDLKFWSQHFELFQQMHGSWFYLGCKRVQHGSNYEMGIPTMQTNVMKDSYKKSNIPVFMEHSDGRALQSYYYLRYPGISLWKRWGQAKLVADGQLTSASGQTRLFFGRRFGKDIHETVKEFLAHEPQSNTTWATNLAMLKLWNDPDNRRPNGSLIIEPLHQVHDALLGQWPIVLRDWARAKVRSYFNNPITIADTTLTIPFDGKFGPSWGELTHNL